ncbi:hypothetical protein TREMEDRAFT_66470 [Tremella mesenterica DSM 1558]|uniref:uncharacterized protein n=1 Tax=Tremella mesenterica (strain ATCC 24925 / CBS 8224 / DSM 1558 / NBRC 9311 / NRRL Y-6157 / RJB 2259-6 / UBC 559-6) TaxID=578456 RepID=UPI00032CCE8E|nr:uncharacterized protein TREMEDRAFT_66470 [Tremella mesenterica DSM 1558]EIW65556.1 hypothetical protein TREMEDRAFT_66470 [Tremella mesenterica DSM 1558]
MVDEQLVVGLGTCLTFDFSGTRRGWGWGWGCMAYRPHQHVIMVPPTTAHVHPSGFIGLPSLNLDIPLLHVNVNNGHGAFDIIQTQQIHPNIPYVNHKTHGVSEQDPIVISDSDDEVVTTIPKSSNNHHAHAQPLQPPSIRSARDKRKPFYHQSQQLGSPSPSSVPLTWYQLRQYASDRLRPIKCHWRECDTLLATPDLLRRHVQVHCAQAIPIAAMRRRKGGFPGAGCEWDKCEEFGFYNSQSLAGHVIKEHIDPLISSWCPFAAIEHLDRWDARTLLPPLEHSLSMPSAVTRHYGPCVWRIDVGHNDGT